MDHSLLRAISLSPGQAYEDCAAHTPAHIRRHIIPDEQEKGCFMYLPTVLDMGRLRLYRMVQATRRDMETAATQGPPRPSFSDVRIYKSIVEIPSQIGITTPPPNPGLPAPGKAITGRPKSLSMKSAPVGSGPARQYLSPKSEPPNMHFPPRPPAGGIVDLDVIMEHCDFATHKYVRDCLEFMRIGTGLDADKRFRRENLEKYNFIYKEVKDKDASSSPKNALKVAPAGVHNKYPDDPDEGLSINTKAIEPEIRLPPPRTPQASTDACDPEHPRIFHMYWTGAFTDKPYMALVSYLFTQNLGLGEELGKAPPPGLCRPEFWMWISPGPAAAPLSKTALTDMFEGLKNNPWASPFLHPRFKDVIKFKLWNTTEQLDGIPEIKDEWRGLDSLFNSGGVVYKPKVAVSNITTARAKKDDNDIMNRVGSGSAQEYDRISTIIYHSSA
ncbi:WD repeat and SOF domain-containing protein 1 [Rhizoctonia solani AG-1 IB]|uniref:WD repeat and SOF domain-containing protein 1 n=1 Tax=Thanatephorus cucumeris (strain AG1-IB / isolate 7/3/14) TaxID=1108050 RepID=M5BM94_THACB|nr:WD repeat and SOF domain-containing protein 1 [Rhizoctonia solani AG-1 IB]